MQLRKTLLSGVLASSLAFSSAAVFAQEATPPSGTAVVNGTPVANPVRLQDVQIFDADGMAVGTAEVWEDENGTGVGIALTNGDNASLAEGTYGVHVHETGVCDPDTTFESAGGHFNPTDEAHGDLNAEPSHAGDLGNIEVDGDGGFQHEVLAEKLTMNREEAHSLADADGSAIIIHAGEDDLATDPSGESGDRWACAVIFPPMDGLGTPAGSPVATPNN